MLSKNPFMKKRRSSEEVSLQITSMADIFTIILVFLLKSYSTSSSDVQLTPGMKLPTASSGEEQVEALKIQISERQVLVEDQPVAPLEQFRFDKTDIQANGSSVLLNTSLQAKKKKQLMISAANTDVSADQKLIVIADQKTPYVTLKSVLASAALSGYTDFKFVVVKKD